MLVFPVLPLYPRGHEIQRLDWWAMRGRLGCLALIFLLVLGGIVGWTPLSNYMAQPFLVPSRLERADAIVVLGGGISSDLSPSDGSLRRLVWGVRLWRRGLAPRIILSGGDPLTPQEIAEAASMGQVARELGFPPSVLTLETSSTRTREHPIEIKRLPNPPRRVLLVSSPVHMYRATRLFEKEGFTVYPAPTDGGEPDARKPGARFDLLHAIIYEGLALGYYWWKGWL